VSVCVCVYVSFLTNAHSLPLSLSPSLPLSLARSLPLSRSLALSLSLSLSRSRSRSLSFSLALSLARARALSLSRPRALSRSRCRSRSLLQAMSEFHDMKAQMLDLRLRQQRLRRIITNGHEAMQKALRLNQGVFSDLSGIIPSMDTNQNTFLHDLLASVRNHDNYPPVCQCQLVSFALSLAYF
jgi:hypothetical protein